MNLADAALALGLLGLPLLLILIEVGVAAQARRRARNAAPTPDVTPVDDFTVLVPIYGDVAYLENVDDLAAYAGRVTLCTTDQESEGFYRALENIAAAHAFSIVRSPIARRGASGRRDVAGTTRDTVIRHALSTVTSTYVICVDADTSPEDRIDDIIGEIAARELDVASLPLTVSNRRSLLGRLQAHEYRMAMRLRRLMPWLCSGACHAGRTDALREVMVRHSLFFQGNDAELGIIADRLGMTTGHLADRRVPTAVPDTWKAWFRQRLAWSGGEFRLYVVNAWTGFRHPFFVLYGAVVVLLLLPLRVGSVFTPGLLLAIVLVAYWVTVVWLNRERIDRALLIYPAYALISSLLMPALGLFSYIHMAVRSRNAGVIRSRRRHQGTRAVSQPAGI